MAIGKCNKTGTVKNCETIWNNKEVDNVQETAHQGKCLYVLCSSAYIVLVYRLTSVENVPNVTITSESRIALGYGFDAIRSLRSLSKTS